MDAPVPSSQAQPQTQSAPTTRWRTVDGKEIPFQAFGLDTQWPGEPALFIFAKRLRVSWETLYIGQARDLSERLAGHEAWAAAVELGMTAVQVHIHTGGVSERMSDEAALIMTFDPPLNGAPPPPSPSEVLYWPTPRE